MEVRQGLHFTFVCKLCYVILFHLKRICFFMAYYEYVFNVFLSWQTTILSFDLKVIF